MKSNQPQVKFKVPKHIKLWMAKDKLAKNGVSRASWMDALRAQAAASRQTSKASREDRVPA
jgi:hypothetical protein